MTTPASDMSTTISSMLRAERHERQLTIREHAALLGISAPTYFRIQAGKVDKTAQALVRIAMSRASRATS